MRRLVLVLMMCLLPLQWTWAAAASICAHEPPARTAHFGHHEHAHGDAAGASVAESGDERAAPAVGDHPDCGVCHGFGGALATGSASLPPGPDTSGRWPPADAPFVDAPLSPLLRPPLTLVA